MEVMREIRTTNPTVFPWVFPGRGGKKPIDLRSPFVKALKEAEIEDFRWHDLRHCTASYLAMNGATLAEIAAVLGHTNSWTWYAAMPTLARSTPLVSSPE